MSVCERDKTVGEIGSEEFKVRFVLRSSFGHCCFNVMPRRKPQIQLSALFPTINPYLSSFDHNLNL